MPLAATQTKPFKLRIYIKSGPNAGNLKREEFFSTQTDLDKRYKQLNPKFVDYAVNPTAWHYVNGEWLRIFGY